jgi:O-antigen ligase
MALLLLGFLTWILVHFGIWSGQPLGFTSEEHSTFLISYVPALWLVVLVTGAYRHLVVLFRFRLVLGGLLVSILLVGFFRPDLTASLRNSSSVLAGYAISIGLAALAFSMSLERALDTLLLFIVAVFLPLTVAVHVTQVGPLVLFPDRTENNMLRLGGLIYYAFTAMTLGVGGLIALFQFLLRYPRFRGRYVAAFLVLNVFLLFTDCRSAWSGVLLSYLVVIYAYVRPFFRLVAVVLGLVLVGAGLWVKDARTPVTKQYDTESDFKFRQRIWYHAWLGIQAEPLTGYGSENYLARSYAARIEIGDQLNDPHSATLSLALQSGLVVTALFFALLGGMALLSYRHAIGPRKGLLALVVFWTFVPFFWGDVYTGKADFIQIFFLTTTFVGVLHPGAYRIGAPRWTVIRPTTYAYETY